MAHSELREERHHHMSADTLTDRAETPAPSHTTGTPDAPEHGLRHALPALIALAIASFVAITTEMLPIGLLPQLSRDLDVSEGQAGLLVSVYALMVALLALPVTAATARFPRRRLLLITLGGYALSNLVVAAAPSFAILAAGRAIGGISHALFFSVAIGYSARLVSPLLIGRAIAVTSTGGSLGNVLGAPLATSFGTAFGWRDAFLVVGAVAAVLTVVIGLLLPPLAGRPRRKRTNGERRARPRTRIVAVTTVLAFLGHFAGWTFIAPMLLRAGASESAIGPLLLVLGGVGVIGVWLAGYLVDRRPRAAFLGTLVAIVLALVVVQLGSSSLGWVIAGAVVWGGAYGLVPALANAAALRTGEVSGDTAGALINSTANAGIALGAVLGGVVVNGPGLGALPAVAAVMMVAALGTVVLGRRAFPARP